MLPSLTMERHWQALCFPEIQSAEWGLERQQDLAERLSGAPVVPALMIWRCRPALLVTRPETRLPGFEAAVAALQADGWPVLLRHSGGGACPVGPGTVQVSTIEAADPNATMKAKYAALADLLHATLASFQIVARTGSVADAYCPGSCDLSVGGKKIAGLSQHWFRNRRGIRCVVTAASLNVEERPDVLAGVVNRFYADAASPLRCRAESLTSMRACDGLGQVGEPDPVSAVMTRLAANAEMIGRAVRTRR